MQKPYKKIILGLLGLAFLIYVVLQGMGLYQIYEMIAGYMEPLKTIVMKNVGGLVFQSVIMIFLWWSLWRDIRWSRYILYFVTVCLYAYGVSILPLIQSTMMASTTWLRFAYIVLLIYYFFMGATCLIYMFHPDFKIQRKPLNDD